MTNGGVENEVVFLFDVDNTLLDNDRIELGLLVSLRHCLI